MVEMRASFNFGKPIDLTLSILLTGWSQGGITDESLEPIFFFPQMLLILSNRKFV